MSNPYLRFTGGALRVRGVQRIAFQEPVPVFTPAPVQVAEIPVAFPEPTPAPVSTPEPLPEPTPAPAPTPELEPVQAPVAEPAPESNVEAPAEVLEAPAESGLVPEDPPA